jgi:hypothetical protein
MFIKTMFWRVDSVFILMSKNLFSWTQLAQEIRAMFINWAQLSIFSYLKMETESSLQNIILMTVWAMDNVQKISHCRST